MLETNLQCGEAFLGPPWQVNVDRGAHTGAQVGGAGVEVAVPVGLQIKIKSGEGQVAWENVETRQKLTSRRLGSLCQTRP